MPKNADDDIYPSNPGTHFREGRAGTKRSIAPPRASKKSATPMAVTRCRVSARPKDQRGGLSVPEAGARRVPYQQCRSLYAALPRLVGRGADGRHRLGRGDRAVQRGEGRRAHYHHRCQYDRESSGRGDLFQAGGEARRDPRGHGPARPGDEAPRDPHAAVQARPGCADAVGAAPHDHLRGTTTSNTSRRIPTISTRSRKA